MYKTIYTWAWYKKVIRQSDTGPTARRRAFSCRIEFDKNSMRVQFSFASEKMTKNKSHTNVPTLRRNSVFGRLSRNSPDIVDSVGRRRKKRFLSHVHVNRIAVYRTNRRYSELERSSSHMRCNNILVCINVFFSTFFFFFFCNPFFPPSTNCIPEFSGPFLP